MRQPPRVATMLLRRLAPPGEEALLGDPVEEYTAGRSGAWYTRQVVAAIIAIGTFRGITEHKLLALRAIAIGWIALLLFFAIAGDVLAGQSPHWIFNRMYYTGQRVFGADTWQVVRFVPAWFCGFFIAGTLVGRTHRVHPAAMLAAFALSVLIVMAGAAIMVWVYPYPTRVPHALFYVIFGALPYVWWVGFVLVPVLIFLAGVCGTATVRETPRE
jgi:hypothetical protein